MCYSINLFVVVSLFSQFDHTFSFIHPINISMAPDKQQTHWPSIPKLIAHIVSYVHGLSTGLQMAGYCIMISWIITHSVQFCSLVMGDYCS